MFPAATNMGGMSMAMPDVCMTPAFPSPVPVPYPNIAQNLMANPATCNMKFIVQCGLAMTLKSQTLLSNGDEAGCSPGGVASGMFIGPARPVVGSMKLLVGGMPQMRMTSMTAQNGMSPNAPTGCNLVPGQVKVLCV